MVVVLAGGTGGAKLARGMLDVVGDELVVVANTGDDVEIYGAYVSPDPDLVRLLAGRPHRRARLGPSRRHLQRDGRSCASSASTSGSTSATATSRSACAARSASPRARRSTEAIARAHARRSGWARASCRWPTSRCARASSPAARWVPFQEFMIRERGAGPGRRRRAPGRRGGARRREASSTRSPARARDHHRAVEPGHLDRADPRGARHQRGAARDRGAVVAVSPIVGGEVLKGPTEAVHGVGRPARRARRGRRAPTTACSTAWSADEPVERPARRSRPTR